MERSGRRGRERLSSLLMTEGQREEQRRRQSKAKRRRMSLSIKVSAGLSSLFGGRFFFLSGVARTVGKCDSTAGVV